MKINEAVAEIFSAFYWSDWDAYKILLPITEMLKITGINRDIKDKLHDPNYKFNTGFLERKLSPENITSGLVAEVKNLISDASKEDIQALDTLARLYSVFGDEGQSMAFEYFKTAAEMGHADAQYSLYLYYEHDALYWLDKAIDSGSKDAIERQEMQLEEKAFGFNDLISSMIPESVTTIDDNTFRENNLTSVTIPNTVTTIGDYAFAWNDLTSVTIPNNVTTIGYMAFYSNKLTSVTIPNSVATIGEEAFENNPLKSVTIGNSVTTTAINGRGFEWAKIKDLSIRNNPNFVYEDGLLLTADRATLILGVGPLTSVTIPNSVTKIGSNAFFRNDLTSITIPNSVTTIGERAFFDNKLTSITIPNSVTTIGYEAYAYNDLTHVTIPNSVTIVGEGAFLSNYLTSVTISNSVTTICDYVFALNQLTSVTIPNSVTTIGEKAFHFNKLKSLTIPDSVIAIGNSAFSSNKLKSITILGDRMRFNYYWQSIKFPSKLMPKKKN